jgi:hypothetical protein
LTVILDAHTDILQKYSITDDFDGFTAIVTPPSDFPLINQQGFGIKTGKRSLKFAETDLHAFPSRKGHRIFTGILGQRPEVSKLNALIGPLSAKSPYHVSKGHIFLYY